MGPVKLRKSLSDRLKRRTMWVHVGAHKTGTSLVQSALLAHREELKRASIFYDRPSYGLGARLKNESPLSPALLRETKEEVHARLSSRPEKHVIFSSEGFFGDPYVGYGNVGDVARDLAAVVEGFDVRIVAVLRQQDTFLESLYVQRIKEGGSMSFEEFATEVGLASFDWRKPLDSYAEVFGAGNVRCDWYEQVILDPAHAAERLFSQLRIVCPAPQSGPVNPSLNRKGLEIARRCNPLLDEQERKILRTFLERQFAKDPREPFDLLADDDRRGVLARFRDSNEACERHYGAGA